jgi:FkbM family methyltransferase
MVSHGKLFNSPSRTPWLLKAALLMSKMAHLDYTLAERISLLSSYLTSAPQTRVLRFRVDYLDRRSFRFLLSEIFFKAEYFFTSESRSPVILDCGANIGLATLFFKHLYPDAHVVAFEPDPDTVAILRKNIEQNHLPDVAVHNVMLSNSEGEHSFFVAADRPGSLLMSATPNRILKGREIKVRAAKLSDYVDGYVDLLKLDVEGAEFDVMADLERSKKLPLIKQMVIEYHHRIDNDSSKLSEFLMILERAGFEYQISGYCDPVTRRDVFQDILIGAYRPV